MTDVNCVKKMGSVQRGHFQSSLALYFMEPLVGTCRFFFVLFVVFLPKWCTGTGTRLAHIYTLQIALVSVKYGTGIYIVSVDLNTRATATGCIKRAEVSNMQTCWSTSLKLSTLIYVHSTMEGAPSTHVEQCPQ